MFSLGVISSSSQSQHLVDGPLIVGMLAVVSSLNRAVGRNEKVCRQTENTTVGYSAEFRLVPPERASYRGRPGAWAENRPDRLLDTIPSIEAVAWVADHVERKTSLVWEQFSVRRMKDDNLPDAGIEDLSVP